jgi:Zn-dependent protease with chaperone function
MGLAETSGSTEFPSIFNIFLQVFTTRYIFLMLGITLLILFLYSYVFFKSRKWILKWYGAQKIQQSEKASLYSILEELSRKAEVNIPELFSFRSEIPSMFTVGSGSKSFITISTSMLEMFNEIELEGLLAHEIGHIKNKDVILNTITAFLAGLIMSFPNFVMWGSMLFGFGQSEDPAPRFFKFIGTAFAAPPAATLIHLTNPAKREFKADDVSVKLTGNPQILAKTIEYLENYIPLQPVAGNFNPGTFHLFSTHTQQMRGYLSMFISFFDTHPGIEDRITRILKNSTNLEEALENKYSRVPGFFDIKSWKFAMAVSLVSYMSLLFGVIVLVTFAIKDFNPLVNGAIAAIYIAAVLLLMGATAKLSRRVHNLNKPSRPIKGKASFAVQRKFLKHFTKKDDKKSDS